MELHLGTMVAQLVIMGVLLFLIMKYALGPVLHTMREREEHIKNQIDTAEKNNEESALLLQQNQELLHQSKVEAKEIIEKAKFQREEDAERIIKEAKTEGNRLLQVARQEIEREREKAFAELKTDVSELVVSLTEKLLAENLDAKKQQEVLDKYLNQAGTLS